MYWETQALGCRGCTGRPVSTVRVRFTATQAVRRSQHSHSGAGATRWAVPGHRASHPSVLPKPGLMLVWGQRCFTTDPPIPGWMQASRNICKTVLACLPDFPAAGPKLITSSCWQSLGQAQGEGPGLPPEPSPPLPPAWPCGAARIRTTSLGWSRTQPMSALHRCINPVARTPAGEEIQHLTD